MIINEQQPLFSNTEMLFISVVSFVFKKQEKTLFDALTHTVYWGVDEWQSWARMYEQVPGK